MKRIEIYYYLYIPPDMRATQWTWFLDQQLGVIKKSGLSFVARTYLIVCMPMHWNSLADGRLFFKNNPPHNESPISFAEKLKEYISLRFPFVEILEMRDVSLPNIYEEAALTPLYNACREREEMYVLYFHSKGSTKSDPSIANWREILNHYIIQKWKEHTVALESGYDVSAMADQMTYADIVSGNFFWANSNYVKTLLPPSEGKTYAKKWIVDEGVHERYAYEKWIRSNNPKLNFIHNTCADHYASCYFLENDLHV